MEQFEIDRAIESFIHPTVYTGVKPVFLVAEELPTKQSIGHVVEAVWVGMNSNKEFTYISKFAVTGKIVLGKYYEASEMEPFCGRLALTNDENLKKVILHRNIIGEIKSLKSKRAALLTEIEKDFDGFIDKELHKSEVYLFEKRDGNWEEELFSDLDIDTPYKIVKFENRDKELRLELENTKTGKIQIYQNADKFYGFFVGSQSEIAGLKLKGESYLKSIISLQSDAKTIIKKIEWLELNDPDVQDIFQSLPKHPFENYFHYTKKENIRSVGVSYELVEALKKIILEHMPENNTPIGMEYIPIDKLLYLFHMIISREEALSALEKCDIVYEPPGILLGHGGERRLPPKFLVPITHVANAYEQFSSFVSVCQNYMDEKVHS